MSSDLQPYLIRLSRRLRLRDGWRLCQSTLWIPTLFAIIAQLVGRILLVERLDWWSLSAYPVWLLTCVAWTVLRPRSLMRTARRLDLELELHERLSTALAFEKPLVSENLLYSEMVQSQHRDAVAKAAAIQPGLALPLTWRTRPLAVAGFLALLAILAAWLPNPMDIVLAQRRAVREEAARQAERVEQLRQQIEQAEELSPDEQAELLRQLAELEKKLRANRGNLEQAVADFSNLEKQLTGRLDANTAVQQANLEALASQLEALTGQSREPGSSAAEASAQALAALADRLPDLSAEEKAELARQLAQLASQSAQSGDADLAQALSALAQASQQGDAQAAQQAAQQAQGALSQAQARLAEQNALQQTISQLQSGRQALAQASQQAGQALAQAQNPGQNPGQGQTPGQNPGSAAGQPGAGQTSGAVTGGGSRASALPAATGGPGNVRPRGQAQNVAPGDLGNQVYSPWQRPANSGGELSIPGLETGQGETQARQGQSNLPGASNPALVPYQQVFNNYLSAANQALGQSYIPAGMADYIRQYFSQLNP